MQSPREEIQQQITQQLDTLTHKYPCEDIQLLVLMRMGKTAIAIKYAQNNFISFAVVTRENPNKYLKFIPFEKREQVKFYISPRDVEYDNIQCVIFDEILEKQKVPSHVQAYYLNGLKLPFINLDHCVKFSYQDAVKQGIKPLLKIMDEKTMPSILKKIGSLNKHNKGIIVICDKTRFSKLNFEQQALFTNNYDVALKFQESCKGKAFVLGTSELISNLSFAQIQFGIILKKFSSENDLIQAAFRTQTWTPWKEESYVWIPDQDQKKIVEQFLKQ